MKKLLIVGLGNVGQEYENTRHNIGFMTLDKFADKHNLIFKYEKKFDGEMTVLNQNDRKLFLLKPHTFMNLSGISVRKLIDFYQIEIDDILVIVDDFNLDLGQIRLREKGSSGGHNGLNNINSYLGTSNYKRLRVGIGQTDKPWVDFVLQKFKKNELDHLFDSFVNAVSIIEDFSDGKNFQTIMSKYNKSCE